MKTIAGLRFAVGLSVAVVVIIAGALVVGASVASAADGEAKGTLSYKGKTLAFKHVYFVKGPDQLDPKKIIRRIIRPEAQLLAHAQ